MCLAQGHNSVKQVRCEPATPRSQGKHSTIEPLHFLFLLYAKNKNIGQHVHPNNLIDALFLAVEMTENARYVQN